MTMIILEKVSFLINIEHLKTNLRDDNTRKHFISDQHLRISKKCMHDDSKD